MVREQNKMGREQDEMGSEQNVMGREQNEMGSEQNVMGSEQNEMGASRIDGSENYIGASRTRWERAERDKSEKTRYCCRGHIARLSYVVILFM